MVVVKMEKIFKSRYTASLAAILGVGGMAGERVRALLPTSSPSELAYAVFLYCWTM